MFSGLKRIEVIWKILKKSAPKKFACFIYYPFTNGHPTIYILGVPFN